MKKQILKSIVAISFLGLLLAVSSKAQTNSQIAVNIPFDFYARNQKFAAGEYLIESVNRSANQTSLVFRLKDGKGRGIVTMLPLETGKNKRETTSALVFNRYGTEYFLTEIRNPLDNFAAALPKSKAEIKLARNYGNPSREIVAANAKK